MSSVLDEHVHQCAVCGLEWACEMKTCTPQEICLDCEKDERETDRPVSFFRRQPVINQKRRSPFTGEARRITKKRLRRSR